MSSDLKCPMMFSLRDDGPATCTESDCAWWHKYKKQCAILVLANTFTLFQKYGTGDKKTSYDGAGGGERGGF
jgi:hypothetical protein